MNNELGQLLRKTRIDKGYSIAEFARLSGLSVTTVSMAEMGKTVPYGKTLKAYAETLGIDLGQLVKLAQRKE